ncbi:hypothetical protein C0989_007338 [Termitomyces sp. Mn162]|nr:hypothetical protein C0989_007338 [Termitomyces sp. Mn162]
MDTGQPLYAASRPKSRPNIQQGALSICVSLATLSSYLSNERDYFLANHGSQDPLMQQLKWENQQMDEMISRRAQGRQSVPFVSLANDNAAQNLLDGMRQDSERLRSARAQQPPADTSDSDLQRLRDEVENLRRENDIYRSLERQTRQTPQRVADTEAERLRDEVDNLRRENERLQTQLIASYFSPPEYAPPPYVRAD